MGLKYIRRMLELYCNNKGGDIVEKENYRHFIRTSHGIFNLGGGIC